MTRGLARDRGHLRDGFMFEGSRRCHADRAVDHHPQRQLCANLGHVLNDARIREARDVRVAGDEVGVSLVSAGSLQCAIDDVELQNISTFRNRATGAPCATRIVCIGSPLPQFGTPQICQLARSPTASHDRQKSGVVPP